MEQKDSEMWAQFHFPRACLLGRGREFSMNFLFLCLNGSQPYSRRSQKEENDRISLQMYEGNSFTLWHFERAGLWLYFMATAPFRCRKHAPGVFSPYLCIPLECGQDPLPAWCVN